MEKSGNIITRNKGKIAFVAAIAGAIVLGPKAWDALEGAINPESKIVAGVPGQVESHSTGRHCGSFIKGNCILWVTDYYLGIEQCPSDVEAARNGQQTTSFDPKVGEYYQNCYVDSVQVGAETWQNFADGSTIIFGGPVGEPVHK
jgi:hypothetical protein